MAALATGDGFPDVVVTAVASTTPRAPDAEDTWQALLQGQSGQSAHEIIPSSSSSSSPVRIGGRLLESFDAQLSHVERRRLSYMQKTATVLGRRVWDNAGSARRRR